MYYFITIVKGYLARASMNHSAGKIQFKNQPSCEINCKLLQLTSFSFQYNLLMKWHYLKLLANMNRFRSLVISKLTGVEIPKEEREILDNHSMPTPLVAVLFRILINLTAIQNDQCHCLTTYLITKISFLAFHIMFADWPIPTYTFFRSWIYKWGWFIFQLSIGQFSPTKSY